MSVRVESGSIRGGPTRIQTICVGGLYRVQPQNPKKIKDRGRICRVSKIASPSCDVVFDDTGRRGRVDLSDLVDDQSEVYGA